MFQSGLRVGSVGACTRELARAAKSVLRHPRLAFAGVLVLSVGIGATTAAFSVVDAVLVRPLPYVRQEGLYAVHESLPRLATPLAGVNALHYREWAQGVRAFEQMAFVISVRHEPLQWSGPAASASRARILERLRHARSECLAWSDVSSG
jgi:hypothetical protein